MISVPIVEAAVFWLLLRKPSEELLTTGSSDTIVTNLTDDNIYNEKYASTSGSTEIVKDIENSCDEEKPLIGFKSKISYVLKLLKYMIPLGLVYFLEYFINQGLVCASAACFF